MRFWSIPILLLLGGCVALTAPGHDYGQESHLKSMTLTTDTVWSGKVVIDGIVKIAKNATLTILPGTEISFVKRDADRDGLGDAVLAVEGELKAVGTVNQPILFHSAEAEPQPGDWLELRVDFSRNVELRYCEIRDSAYTLHAHFTRGVVEDCIIHHNIDGSRLGQANFVLRNNLIENNLGKGINFRNSTVTLERNIIRHNGAGIFLFETDREFTIRQNNLYGNKWNFRVGDFFTKDVALIDNWWGTADPQSAAATVFDRKEDASIGSVSLAPASAWVMESGPRDGASFEPFWTLATEGFIDAPPVLYNDTLYIASWDGSLHALDSAGQVQWRVDTGDVIDAQPVVDREYIYLQNWSREVQARDRTSGQLRWTFTYPESPADDHRQAGLLLVDDLLLVPSWNGTLYALRTTDGKPVWQYAAGQPLRAMPTVGEGRIYLPSGSGRLSVLDLAGKELWVADGFAPLLSSPLLISTGPVVLDKDGVVTAFNLNGNRLWTRNLEEACFYAAPVADETDDKAIYIATAGGSLWKLNSSDGTIIWRHELGASTYATPLLAGKRLYQGLNDGRLLVINADSGDLLTTQDIGAPVQSVPLLNDGILYFGSRDHKLHALRIIEQP